MNFLQCNETAKAVKNMTVKVELYHCFNHTINVKSLFLHVDENILAKFYSVHI